MRGERRWCAVQLQKSNVTVGTALRGPAKWTLHVVIAQHVLHNADDIANGSVGSRVTAYHASSRIASGAQATCRPWSKRVQYRRLSQRYYHTDIRGWRSQILLPCCG